MKSAKEVRDGLIEFFRRDLVGPAHGTNETLEERPSLRYSAGVLFPPKTVVSESSESGGVGADPDETTETPDEAPLDPGDENVSINLQGEATGSEEEADDVVTLANTYKPSALAISFVSAPGVGVLHVTPLAAIYIKVQLENRKKPGWQRQELQLKPETIALQGSQRFETEREVSKGLRLRLRARPRADGSTMCTLCLYNSSQTEEFFQTALSVVGDCTEAFSEYASADLGASDPEELALAMLYRERRVFAIGHGCAADWEAKGRLASKLATSTIPVVTVPPVVPTAGGSSWLDMRYLSGELASDSELLSALEEFVEDYRKWIAEKMTEAANIEPAFSAPAREHLEKCKRAAARIDNGISELRHNAHSLEAFKLMNRAMLYQQVHAKQRHRSIDSSYSKPQYDSYHDPAGAGVRGFWRRFQLAFILMSLPGVVPDANVGERELVDLIWFPTGGGKTEAYLGLSAFCLFRRRFAAPSDNGCAILMRYTLRLLTSQQFQRAASLICACESIRRSEVSAGRQRIGSSRFTIGLWVGKSLTPNSEDDARRICNNLSRPDKDQKNAFQLLNCPWCGTELDNKEKLGYVLDHSRVVRFRCPNTACEYSTIENPLPVSVVDETLYREPPSLLIGTVDKFAMLTWRPEARNLFGSASSLPPDLIIQDELHLISGPLGSMVGLYEGLVEKLCESTRGVKPKIVASTATIRRAQKQCRDLYDRDMFQFPPQGLSASDSYFAEEKSDSPGRTYVGVLPTAASSPLTAQVRAAAALLQGVLGAGRAKADIDPYWTLVQYFSSLKELGRAATLVSGDIPEYFPAMHRRYSIPTQDRRRIYGAEELTSRKQEDEIPEILKKMGRRFDPTAAPSDQPPDTVLATNMISVGVDVDRLGLMMVVTQPKGTSEYIQASSRVGRSAAAPGLVVTLYNASRPRDRSHYEQFRPYHDAFYRYVEPTSVTPFSLPAMERALHGVMVAAARQLAKFSSPEDIQDKAHALALEAVLNDLRKRVERVDVEHVDIFDQVLAQRMKQWRSSQVGKWGDFGANNEPALMYPAGSTPPAGYEDEAWSTPSSLRSVDAECDGRVVNYVVEE